MTDKTQKPSNPKQYFSDTTSIHDFFKCLSEKITICLECSYVINNVFKIQKIIIRIITNSGTHDTCRPLFKNLKILSLPSQYIFSLLNSVTRNRGLFQLNSEIHNLNTRFNHNLHIPSTNLTLVQKGVLFSGSKIYNHLPSNIKALVKDTKLFKFSLKNYLIEHSFYSLEEFYQSAS
jgi:hypothetical protein